MREVWRKVFHILIGVALLAGAIYVGKKSLNLLSGILFGALMLSLLGDFVIADLRIRLPIYNWIERKRERHGIHSSTLFLVSSILALQFFSFEVALTAISILVFGDAAAALVGKKWGKPWLRKKSILGSSTMFIVSLAVGFIFLSNPFVIVAMALVGTATEIFVDKIDDNLMIPLFAGLAGHLLLLVL